MVKNWPLMTSFRSAWCISPWITFVLKPCFLHSSWTVTESAFLVTNTSTEPLDVSFTMFDRSHFILSSWLIIWTIWVTSLLTWPASPWDTRIGLSKMSLAKCSMLFLNVALNKRHCLSGRIWFAFRGWNFVFYRSCNKSCTPWTYRSDLGLETQLKHTIGLINSQHGDAG